MTDYSELAKRLREHAENMYVDFLNEAADALEAQAKEIADKDARIAELEAAYMELRMALKNWDSLIRHQYTGSSEAMSDMHACAQETVKLLYGPGPWPNVPPALR